MGLDNRNIEVTSATQDSCSASGDTSQAPQTRVDTNSSTLIEQRFFTRTQTVLDPSTQIILDPVLNQVRELFHGLHETQARQEVVLDQKIRVVDDKLSEVLQRIRNEEVSLSQIAARMGVACSGNGSNALLDSNTANAT